MPIRKTSNRATNSKGGEKIYSSPNSIRQFQRKMVSLPFFHSWRRRRGREKKFVLVTRNAFISKRPTYNPHNVTGSYRIPKSSRSKRLQRSLRLRYSPTSWAYLFNTMKDVRWESRLLYLSFTIRLWLDHIGTRRLWEAGNAQSSNFMNTSTYIYRWEGREGGFILQSLQEVMLLVFSCSWTRKAEAPFAPSQTCCHERVHEEPYTLLTAVEPT